MSRNKEQAKAAGVRIADTHHHMNRRSPWHNYSSKNTYMLTLVVEGRRPLLGRLAGEGVATMGKPVWVELSALGRAIRDEEVKKIAQFYPMVEVWKLCIMREAMNCGYHVILLRENGFPPLYKPSGEAFSACAEGRLLQVSPWDYHMEHRTISREQCLQLNRLAEMIAAS